MEALYSCFILIRSPQQCISTEPELEREPETKDFELNGLAISAPNRQ